MQSGLHGDTYPDVETAVTAAKEKANKNDFIFVGGSSFIAVSYTHLDTPIPPCGACRQVLLETEKRYGKPMRILLYSKTDIYI